MGKRGGCPALWRVSRPLFILGFRWCLSCRMLLLVVCLAPVVSGGWSVVLVVSLAGCCPGLPGRSGPLHWRRLLPVSWRRRALGLSGLLVLLSVGWLWFGAGNGPALGAVPCRWRPQLWVLSLAADLAVPALIGGKSDRQREEKPPSGNQQNQRGAFASRSKTTINGRPKRQRRRRSAQAYESKV